MSELIQQAGEWLRVNVSEFRAAAKRWPKLRQNKTLEIVEHLHRWVDSYKTGGLVVYFGGLYQAFLTGGNAWGSLVVLVEEDDCYVFCREEEDEFIQRTSETAYDMLSKRRVECNNESYVMLRFDDLKKYFPV